MVHKMLLLNYNLPLENEVHESVQNNIFRGFICFFLVWGVELPSCFCLFRYWPSVGVFKHVHRNSMKNGNGTVFLFLYGGQVRSTYTGLIQKRGRTQIA